MWALIRIRQRDGSGRMRQRRGQIVKLYEVGVDGYPMNEDGVKLDFGGPRSRQRSAKIRIRGIPRRARRAITRSDRRTNRSRRFRLDLDAIVAGIPQAPRRRWLRDSFDPAVVMTEAQIMSRSIHWDEIKPHLIDRRSNAAATEAVVLGFDPDDKTQAEPPLAR